MRCHWAVDTYSAQSHLTPRRDPRCAECKGCHSRQKQQQQQQHLPTHAMASDLPSATILTDPEIVFNDDAAAAAGQTNPPPKQRFGFAEVFRQLAAGTVGGIACTVVGYPFDTFKVRMQMGSSFRDIARSLTWRTLFAGVAAPIYGAMPAWAAGYAGYNIGKHIVALAGGGPSSDTETSGRGPVRVSTLEIFIGGFTSGVLGSIVRGPTDVVKVNCQNQGKGNRGRRSKIRPGGGSNSCDKSSPPLPAHPLELSVTCERCGLLSIGFALSYCIALSSWTAP